MRVAMEMGGLSQLTAGSHDPAGTALGAETRPTRRRRSARDLSCGGPRATPWLGLGVATLKPEGQMWCGSGRARIYKRRPLAIQRLAGRSQHTGMSLLARVA